MSALHPNLARIAAAYDDIIMSFGSGLLTAPQARAQIDSLTARDDNGVEWSLDPDTGEWRFMTREGEHVYGEPPTWGLATLTPNDLGAGIKDPDNRITFYEVDQRLQSGLTGATQRLVPKPENAKRRLPKVILFISLATATLITLIVFDILGK